MSFLVEAHIDRGDELLGLFEKSLGRASSTADRRLDELRRQTDRDKAALARLGIRLSELVLDAHRRGEETIEVSVIAREIGLQKLQAAVDSNKALAQPAEASRNAELHSRSPGFRGPPGGSCGPCRCAPMIRIAG